ncbi:hypothetical protein [Brevundimonas aurantiaca]|uniref:hypothetical protein n=1 Tax=Brevundimonas aurantiaca TaxID=74316 RepID=UPI001602D262|nr:hypothetical protein [Pseudomonas sp. FW305-3-2-15-E-TSA4]
MSNVVHLSDRGEDLRADDPVKKALYPLANRAIVALEEDPSEHVRAHLVAPTVMAVAAAAMFKSTLDRPRGVAMLRELAEILERNDFGSIPWGPKHPDHKRAIQTLIDEKRAPTYDPADQDAMLSLMDDMEAEFTLAMDRLVERYLDAVETADEFLLHGFLMQFMIKRYGRIEEPEDAWSTVRHAAIDQGWIEP